MAIADKEMEMEKEIVREEKEGLNQYVDISFLDKDNAVFERTEGGILTLKYLDKSYQKILLYRIFPFSMEEEYISVRDEKNEEIGIIKSFNDLNSKARKIIRDELDWIYFCPIINKVYNLEEEFGYSYWEVETDHGKKEFTLRGNKAITPIAEKRILITDLEGNRYQIKDIDSLDKASLKLIDSVL